MLITVGRALVLVGAVSACSLAPPSGWTVTQMALDSDQGSLAAGQIRLQLSEYAGSDDWSATREAQAVLDFDSGELVAHDASMEFMPRVLGYASDTAVGNLSAGVASVEWGPYGVGAGGAGAIGSGSFALPTAASALWWYSPSLDRLFSIYEASGGVFGIAACSNATGACMHASLSGTTPVIDWADGAVVAWDEERLVGVPLMCCVCTSYEYYAYALLDDGTPSLTVVPALNQLGAVAYDAPADLVYAASGDTGDGGAVTIARYNYATHETASVELTAARIRAIVPGIPAWAIALIIVGALVLVLAGSLLAAKLLHARAKRRQQPMRSVPPPKAAA
jgi:hypothetical protein